MFLATILFFLLIVMIITFLALLVPTLLIGMYLIAFMMTSPPRGSTLPVEQFLRVHRQVPGGRPTDYVELEQAEPDNFEQGPIEETNLEEVRAEAGITEDDQVEPTDIERDHARSRTIEKSRPESRQEEMAKSCENAVLAIPGRW